MGKMRAKLLNIEPARNLSEELSALVQSVLCTKLSISSDESFICHKDTIIPSFNYVSFSFNKALKSLLMIIMCFVSTGC